MTRPEVLQIFIPNFMPIKDPTCMLEALGENRSPSNFSYLKSVHRKRIQIMEVRWMQAGEN